MSDFQEHLDYLNRAENTKYSRAFNAINDPATAKAFEETYGHSHEQTTGKSDAEWSAIYRLDKAAGRIVREAS